MSEPGQVARLYGMLTITQQSHLDHNLSLDHIRFVLRVCGDRNAFFIESLQLPDELPSLPCGLFGPVVGHPPIPDSDVVYVNRNGRPWASRVLQTRRALPQSRILTIIGGPTEGLSCVLYTAYGGPLAPRELGDPSLPESEREASESFWADHALAE